MYMYVYIYIYIYIHMMCGSKLSGFLSGVDRGRVQSSALGCWAAEGQLGYYHHYYY